MAKRFRLSDKQNIKIPVPEKFQDRFGMHIKSDFKPSHPAVLCRDAQRGSKVGTAVATKKIVDKKNISYKKKVSAKKKKKKKKSNNIEFSAVIRAIAFVIMFCSLAVLSDYASGYVRDIELNNAIVDEYGIVFYEPDEKVDEFLIRDVPKYPIEETESSGEDGQRFKYPVVSSVDSIKNLSTVYKDFVFWMYIADTSVNYSVVQSVDNDFYLRRNINGETNLSGTLFLDYRNESNMSYGNNIVYGHNMQNGTMFGSLKKYSDKAFFDSHLMIYTYTATEVTAWKIFSVYETTTDNYYIQTEFVNKDNYFEFIKGLKQSSIYPSDVELTADTPILTLSTCHKYDYANGRFVIHAAKVFTSAIS